MLHRIAYKLRHNFCIDWSQLKRTQWTRLEDRTLLVLQGPDSHKYLSIHAGWYKAWSQMISESWERRRYKTSRWKGSPFSLSSCSQKEKSLLMPSSSAPGSTKKASRNTYKTSFGWTSTNQPRQPSSNTSIVTCGVRRRKWSTSKNKPSMATSQSYMPDTYQYPYSEWGEHDAWTHARHFSWVGWDGAWRGRRLCQFDLLRSKRKQIRPEDRF